MRQSLDLPDTSHKKCGNKLSQQNITTKCHYKLLIELVEHEFTVKVMQHPLFIYIENHPDWLPSIKLRK